MKYLSYILMATSVLLAILALVLLLKKEAILRDNLLDSLADARIAKKEKQQAVDKIADEKEMNLNKKDNAGTKKENK